MRISASLRIEKTVEEVFAFLTANIENLDRKVTVVGESKWTATRRPERGSLSARRYSFSRKAYTLRYEVAQNDEAGHPGLPLTGHFRVEPAGWGVRLTNTIDYRAGGTVAGL